MLSHKEKTLLLLPKALPTSSHYQNLRHVLSKADWQKLRLITLKEAKYQCELCQQKKARLDVHELWQFDFKLQVQFLDRLVALCHNCHALQHALLLKLHADQKKRNAQVVVNHYNKLVNKKLTEVQFFALANQVAKVLEKPWTIIVNPLLWTSKSTKKTSP